jgi:hypothetical protein
VPLVAICFCLYYVLAHGLPSVLQHFDQEVALRELAAPLAVAAVILLLMVRYGKFLVNKPQLCPQLANTLG